MQSCVPTNSGDIVLDPFSGRGTTILEALINNRRGIACDINPVAATISAAKSRPPTFDSVLNRIALLERVYKTVSRASLHQEAVALPEFFRHAFHPDTLLQILSFLEKKPASDYSQNRHICYGTVFGPPARGMRSIPKLFQQPDGSHDSDEAELRDWLLEGS